MPINVYECTNSNCMHKGEELQLITEEPLTVCPKCGHSTYTKIIATGTIPQFIGEGFYINDYKRRFGNDD